MNDEMPEGFWIPLPDWFTEDDALAWGLSPEALRRDYNVPDVFAAFLETLDE